MQRHHVVEVRLIRSATEFLSATENPQVAGQALVCPTLEFELELELEFELELEQLELNPGSIEGFELESISNSRWNS